MVYGYGRVDASFFIYSTIYKKIPGDPIESFHTCLLKSCHLLLVFLNDIAVLDPLPDIHTTMLNVTFTQKHLVSSLALLATLVSSHKCALPLTLPR